MPKTTGSLAIAVLIAAFCMVPATGYADGMPKPPPAKHRVHHRVYHPRAVTAIVEPPYAPVYCERPAYPPPSYATIYDHLVVDYFRCPSITGYRPGSTPEESGGVRYSRAADWSVRPVVYPPQAPRPPQIDAFPYRGQVGPVIVQYDGATGAYIPLSARDAQRAVASIAATVPAATGPVPLTR